MELRIDRTRTRIISKLLSASYSLYFTLCTLMLHYVTHNLYVKCAYDVTSLIYLLPVATYRMRNLRFKLSNSPKFTHLKNVRAIYFSDSYVYCYDHYPGSFHLNMLEKG